jgi:hypothetical protein
MRLLDVSRVVGKLDMKAACADPVKFLVKRVIRPESVNAARLIRPISAGFYLGASLRSSAAILVRRLANRSSTCEAPPLVLDSVRRNISRTC